MADVEQPVTKSRRALPSGRAVLGALLITLAALGVLFASRLGDDATFQNVVVARIDISPGTVIDESDVATVRLRLDEQADGVINDINDVLGNVALGPVAQLEFLQRSNVASGLPDSVPSGAAVVSLSVPPENAPPSIAAGELVSVLATFEGGEVPVTELIADRVSVLSFGGGGAEDFSSNETVLRLGVSDGEIASAIVHASQTGTISIVGVTGAPDVQIPQATS